MLAVRSMIVAGLAMAGSGMAIRVVKGSDPTSTGSASEVTATDDVSAGRKVPGDGNGNYPTGSEFEKEMEAELQKIAEEEEKYDAERKANVIKVAEELMKKDPKLTKEEAEESAEEEVGIQEMKQVQAAVGQQMGAVIREVRDLKTEAFIKQDEEKRDQIIQADVKKGMTQEEAQKDATEQLNAQNTAEQKEHESSVKPELVEMGIPTENMTESETDVQRVMEKNGHKPSEGEAKRVLQTMTRADEKVAVDVTKSLRGAQKQMEQVMKQVVEEKMEEDLEGLAEFVNMMNEITGEDNTTPDDNLSGSVEQAASDKPVDENKPGQGTGAVVMTEPKLSPEQLAAFRENIDKTNAKHEEVRKQEEAKKIAQTVPMQAGLGVPIAPHSAQTAATEVH